MSKDHLEVYGDKGFRMSRATHGIRKVRTSGDIYDFPVKLKIALVYHLHMLRLYLVRACSRQASTNPEMYAQTFMFI